MKNLRLLPIAVLLASLCAAAPQKVGGNKDEQEIRALYARWLPAFRAKDVDSIMRAYAHSDDLFLFDVTPPRAYVGFLAVQHDYQDFFAAFPGSVDRGEIQELSIVTDGKLGYTHLVEPMILTTKDGSKFNLTLRITDGLRKTDGKWLITQEHVSVPVDLETGKADLSSKP
jgi:ketosteroid isomerase-like protein